jgi:hypothetical protein
VYNQYVPAKVEILHPGAKKHPDPIVETASLAGVVAPEITYALSHHLDVSGCACVQLGPAPSVPLGTAARPIVP